MAETSTPSLPHEVELEITGMTCASCAMRIEKKLNRMDGVSAAVNYATEKASVSYADDVTPDDLVATVERTGYGAALPAPPAGDDDADVVGDRPSGHRTAALRTRLLVAVVLTVPVMAMSMVPAWQVRGWQWICLALATPVVLWAGYPFHRAAAVNLRHRAATMDTLVSLGTLAAYLWSVYALVLGTAGELGMRHHFSWVSHPDDGASTIYLEAAAGVITFILGGRYLEARAKRDAGSALRALLELGAKDVAVVRDGVETRVPVEQLAVGDEFVVRPGEKVATDGVVVDGASAIDSSMMTGESVPQEVSVGDGVTGGTVSVGGRLLVQATRVGKDTALAHMARLVEEAQSGKAQVQRLADRVSAVFVPVVLVLALATLLVWLAVGAGPVAAFTAAVAVLVVACPCALGLATPMALLVGTGRGAQLGVLITGPEVLESTREVDTVVLDKTGTVTTGVMTLSEVRPAPGADRDEVLAVAAALENGSEHPIARAVVQGYGAEPPAVSSFVGHAGLGVSGEVGGRTAVVGTPQLLSRSEVDLEGWPAQALEEARATGATAVLVAWDGAVRGVVLVADEVKPTAAQAISDLRRLGLEPHLLTGDHEVVARQVAAEVGIDQVTAGVLPSDKADVIAGLQQQGRTVAMVGDGVNDAAALATADLGLAMGTGTDAAIQASDLTLVRGDLRAVPDAIRLSRRTLSTIKGNLVWAFAYNVAMIPLAMSGRLNPMLAGLAMALSSLFVVGNSLRLKTFRPLR